MQACGGGGGGVGGLGGYPKVKGKNKAGTYSLSEKGGPLWTNGLTLILVRFCWSWVKIMTLVYIFSVPFSQRFV